MNASAVFEKKDGPVIGGKGIDAGFLKILTLILMIFDHAIVVFVPQTDLVLWNVLRVPGRICAPVMCYLVAEGFRYTHDLKKYAFRLFIFAVISHAAYNLCFYGKVFYRATSMMWGLFLGLAALYFVKLDISKKIKNKVLIVLIKLAVLGVCCLLARDADWNYIGVLWIVAFGIFAGNRKYQLVSFAAVSVLFWAQTYVHFGFSHLYQLGIVLFIPLFLMYNGTRGIKSKAFSLLFYVLYPVHLLILWALHLIF